MMAVRMVSSPDNPVIRLVRKLSSTPTAYRQIGKVWIEGDHLCRSWVQHQGAVEMAVVSATAWAEWSRTDWLQQVSDVVVVPDAQFARMSQLPSPAGIGLLLPWMAEATIAYDEPSVILDRVQDAGNVGSILRSAAAMGVRQVMSLPGTAALWSPKVIRAGMGAQFGIKVVENIDLDMIAKLSLPVIATSSHAKQEIWDTHLTSPCNWMFGHEGQGLSPACEAMCAATVRIPQPGGQESLNVAAAAAICLYESMRRRHIQDY